MHIQPCTNKNGVKNATVNFRSQKSDAYFSYMSEKSDDIITISSISGAAIGLIAAKDNFKTEAIPKALNSVGVVTLILFTLASANFLTSKSTKSGVENNN